MTCYPFLERVRSYHEVLAATFNCPREDPRGPRIHAACDLYAPVGTAVLSPEAGTVTMGPYPFYKGSDAIEITFTDGRVVRLGECKFFRHIKPGYKVEAGEFVGWVSAMEGMPQTMLHFELYSGKAKGGLTTQVGPTFRRADLIDPTAYLDGLPLLSELNSGGLPT